jgi:hypothetical protein
MDTRVSVLHCIKALIVAFLSILAQAIHVSHRIPSLVRSETMAASLATVARVGQDLPVRLVMMMHWSTFVLV